MTYEQVLAAIVMGGSADEAPADLLTMVHMCESFLPPLRNNDSPFLRSFPGANLQSSGKAKSVYIAGALLCLLFEPVKQQSYADRMRRMRARFDGISSSPSLQARFSNGLEKAARAGAFRSWETASVQLPEALLDA